MKNYFNKSETFNIFDNIYIYYMGRPKKEKKDCKIKFGISIDRDLFDKMVKEKTKKSSLINKLLREYYGKKNMQ